MTANTRRRSSRIAPIDPEALYAPKNMEDEIVMPPPNKLSSFARRRSSRIVPTDIEVAFQSKTRQSSLLSPTDLAILNAACEGIEDYDDDYASPPNRGERIPPPQPTKVKTTRICSNICTLICLAVIVFVTVLVIMVTVYTNGRPLEFFEIDDAPGINGTNRWYTANEERLHLQVVNSLDDEYDSIFDEYIYKWSQGLPDIVKLYPQKAAQPDPECTPIEGMMNVCNGNYGETDWRGINIVFLHGTVIVNSIAKLNDYFLKNESHDQKAYTACHEMGHGLGLPHTDESYYNVDRGDCMDYTLRPNNNLEPGQHNFDLLRQMYGPPMEGEEGLENENINDTAVYPGSKILRKIFRLTTNNDEVDELSHEGVRKLKEDVPFDVLERYATAVHEIEYGHQNRKLALDSEENHLVSDIDIDLGYGYHVVAHKLHAHTGM